MRSIELLRPIMNNDLTGFQFGDYHSSQFGLVRVSSGSRYSEYLSPTFKNTTVDTVGAEGTLYFGRQDSTRTFQIDLAFDSITESELRDIKEWLNNGTQPLIFDERPYVQYYCTLSAAPQIKYLTFYEKNVRIYKGEISVNFISYYPYGFSTDRKFIDDYLDDNFDEWADASRLVYKSFMDGSISRNYDTYYTNIIVDTQTVKGIYTYNSGDFDTDFILEFKYTAAGSYKIFLNSNSFIKLQLPAATSGTNTIQINTKLELIKLNNMIANDLLQKEEDIKSTFFKLPRNQQRIQIIGSISDVVIKYKNKFL